MLYYVWFWVKHTLCQSFETFYDIEWCGGTNTGTTLGLHWPLPTLVLSNIYTNAGYNKTKTLGLNVTDERFFVGWYFLEQSDQK